MLFYILYDLSVFFYIIMLLKCYVCLGRPRRSWEGNIRMDLEEIGINAGNWVDSAQDRNYWRALGNAALDLRVP